MDGMQLAVPIAVIVAAAAVTFYAVSFAELSEKSFQDLEDKEESTDGGGLQRMNSSRDGRRARIRRSQAQKPNIK